MTLVALGVTTLLCKLHLKTALILNLLMTSFLLGANEGVSDTITNNITTQLKKIKTDITILSITHSPINKLYKVKVKGSKQVLFSNSDGSYFISGDMYTIKENKLFNLQQPERVIDQLKQVSNKDMIIYDAIKATKHIIYIFTDVDCPYCVKLHNEIPSLTRYGIQVNYLAYPRAGLYSPSHSKIAAAWCAADPQKALPLIQRGEYDKLDDDCESDVIDRNFSIGNNIGINGTPTIVFPNGHMISGYRSANEIIKTLNNL